MADPSLMQGQNPFSPEIQQLAETIGNHIMSIQSAAPPGLYETSIPPDLQPAYQQWKQQYAPRDSGVDYDLPGAFLAGVRPDPLTGHMPDTFKKPNHPTFSNESQYAPMHPELAGQWTGPNRDQYQPASQPAPGIQQGPAGTLPPPAGSPSSPPPGMDFAALRQQIMGQGQQPDVGMGGRVLQNISQQIPPGTVPGFLFALIRGLTGTPEASKLDPVQLRQLQLQELGQVSQMESNQQKSEWYRNRDTRQAGIDKQFTDALAKGDLVPSFTNGPRGASVSLKPKSAGGKPTIIAPPGGTAMMFDTTTGTLKPVPVEGGGTYTRPAAPTKPPQMTSSTRTMIEASPKVLQLADRVDGLIDSNYKQLGPAQGRWAEFMAGKVGSPNPQFTKLRTDVGLLTTLLMRMHVGARGGEYVMKHFQDMIDSGRQSPENLHAAISEIRSYAQDVQAEGQPQKTKAAPLPSPAVPQGWSVEPLP